MAKRKNAKAPPRGTPFKKGKSGNPRGRAADPPGFKKLKNLTKKELVAVGNVIVKGTYDDLAKIATTDKKASVLHKMVASISLRIIQNGDMDSFDKLLNRLIGKVKEDDSLTILLRKYDSLSDEELARIAVEGDPDEIEDL